MPRRLTNNEIVSRFGRYGFTVIEPNFQYRNNKQRIRVRDDIMNRERTITLNNFQSLIRRGRLPEVDPFLHALNRADTLEQQLSKLDPPWTLARSGPVPSRAQ